MTARDDRQRGLILVAPLALLCGLAFAWQHIATTWPSVLPPIEAVILDLIERWPFYLGHAWATLRSALTGFAIGALAGGAAAALSARNRYVEAAILPLAVTLSVTPIVAIAPALIIAFGFTDAPRIIVAALSSLFPMFVNVLSGIRRTDKAAIDVFRSLSASGWDRLIRLELPSSLPSIFAGARLAITAAIIGTLVSEFTGTSRGLGAVIMLATTYLNLAQMWTAIFLSVAMSLCLLAALTLVERLVVRW